MILDRWYLSLVMLTVLPSFAMCQGKLGDIREDVWQAESAVTPAPRKKDRAADRNHHCHEDEPSFLGILLGSFFTAIIHSATEDRPTHTTVHVVDQPPPSRPKIKYQYPAYPYPLGLPGYVQEVDTSIAHITGHEEDLLDLKLLSLRLQLEDGNDFTGLNRLNGQLLVEGMTFGIHTSWNYYAENLAGGGSDDAVFGNIHVTSLWVKHPEFQLRTGIGCNLFSDDQGTESGLNLLIGFDVYPCRPLVVSGQFDGGWLGDTGTWHTRATVGYLFRGVELYGGYDYRQIGSTNLHGPLVGVRLWF